MPEQDNLCVSRDCGRKPVSEGCFPHPRRRLQLGMIALERCQFHVFGMGAFVHGIVHNEHVLTRRIRQRFDEPDDPSTKQNQELLPVDLAIIEQVAERLIREVQLILMFQIIAIRRLV